MNLGLLIRVLACAVFLDDELELLEDLDQRQVSLVGLAALLHGLLNDKVDFPLQLVVLCE